MKKLLFLPIALSAFLYEPYFPDLLEFHFIPAYEYKHSTAIDGARPFNFDNTSHTFTLGLGTTFYPDWYIHAETEFSKDDVRSWGTRSASMQIRYLILDDTGGDPISLAVGAIPRWTKTRYLQTPTTPYSSNFDLELSAAIGKEFTNTYDWLFRLWGYAAVGQGNRGSAWLRPIITFEGNLRDKNTYAFFTQGFFGFGENHFVNTANFNGWARIRHQSIEIGVAYSRRFDVYGTLKLSFAYRPVAHNYPRSASIFNISYDFPFSPF